MFLKIVFLSIQSQVTIIKSGKNNRYSPALLYQRWKIINNEFVKRNFKQNFYKLIDKF